MTFNLKLEVDEDYINEYYGPAMFGEMLKEEINSALRKVIKEELKADDLRLAAEVRRILKGLSFRMSDTEVADLAYALVDSMVKHK